MATAVAGVTAPAGPQSALDRIDASNTDFSEKLSRKVLLSLRTLNDSLGQVRASVAKIDLIAHNPQLVSRAAALNGGHQPPAAAATAGGVPPASSAHTPAAAGVVPPSAPSTTDGTAASSSSPSAAAASPSVSRNLAFGGGAASSNASSSAAAGAVSSGGGTVAPPPVPPALTPALVKSLALASASAGARLDASTMDQLRQVVDPATLDAVERAQQRSATPPPPPPPAHSAAASATPATDGSPATPAAVATATSTPAATTSVGSDAPAPDTGRRLRHTARPDDGDGDGADDGDGGSDTDSDVPLEEHHMTDVQFFAIEGEAAELRAARDRMMKLKAEREAEKARERGEEPPAAAPESGEGAGAGAGAGVGVGVGVSADTSTDANKPKPAKSVSDAEWPMVPDTVDVSGRPAKFEAFNLRIVFESGRTGFEELKDFQAPVGSVIAGRYYVRDFLGSAAFSNALSCEDLVTGQDVCLKVIKNNKDFLDQSLDEIKLLRYINSMGDTDDHHVLRLHEYFYHKEHLILVTELLKDNLYEFQKYLADAHEPPYFTLPRLQRIAKQVLQSLVFIHSLGLIHCDLKPENILIKSYSRCEVKVIDFGSSCYVTDHLSSYIQSRSYRAPEVILGLPYGTKIDIWSFGCILAELLTGRVLFQSESTQAMLARMVGIVGDFPAPMLANGRDVPKFFNSKGEVFERTEDGSGYVILRPKRTSLRARLKCTDDLFMSFVESLLTLDPDKRPSAKEALTHPWLAADLPMEPYVLPQ